jgi:thiol-disulfide isomerase/thioredoxin
MNYLTMAVVFAVGYFLFSAAPLNPNEPSFTLYHWSSCGHCKRMMPDFNRLGSMVGRIRIRKIERSFNTEYPVSSFPTLIYRDGRGGLEQYAEGRDYASMMSFLNNK